MGKHFFASGTISGFQFDHRNQANQRRTVSNEEIKRSKSDEDLVIEDNTIYEIDRECYERLKRQRKRRVQERKRI